VPRSAAQAHRIFWHEGYDKAYSFARIGAVVGMTVDDYFANGKRWWVRLHEKGGKVHEMPAHHKLEQYLDEYLTAAGIRDQGKTPLFRSTSGRTGVLTDRPMHRIDAYLMVRRRTAEAGLKECVRNAHELWVGEALQTHSAGAARRDGTCTSNSSGREARTITAINRKSSILATIAACCVTSAFSAAIPDGLVRLNGVAREGACASGLSGRNCSMSRECTVQADFNVQSAGSDAGLLPNSVSESANLTVPRLTDTGADRLADAR
jgi:hypothetical protein